MPENEPIPQSHENPLKKAELLLEKHQDILAKVDSSVRPEDLAKDNNIDTLAEVLSAVGLFFGTSKGEERTIFMKRYRVLEKAWRLKAIEDKKNQEK